MHDDSYLRHELRMQQRRHTVFVRDRITVPADLALEDTTEKDPAWLRPAPVRAKPRPSLFARLVRALAAVRWAR